MLACHEYLEYRERSPTKGVDGAPLGRGEVRVGTTANDNSAMMIEQALACAAKYRVLASSEPNQLMVQLFEQNADWLEGTAARLQRSGYRLSEARS